VTARPTRGTRDFLGRLAGRPLSFLLAVAATPALVGGQLATREAPLRFGIEYARATPVGEFRDVTGEASGFASWLALPLSGTSWLGLIGEFSVLTVPERSLDLPAIIPGVDATVGQRTTLTFVGVGPRLETRAGRVSLGLTLMPGFTRVITDVNAVIRSGEAQISDVATNSEYALGLKSGLYLAVPLYLGRQSTGAGIVTGIDYTVSGRAPFPRDGSFGYDPEAGELLLERPEVALTHWRWHVGVGLEF